MKIRPEDFRMYTQTLEEGYVREITERWSANLKAAESAPGFNEQKAAKLAVVLENTHREWARAAGRLSEATQAIDVGPFKRHSFDLLTAVMPNLLIEDIFSVQPMTQKLGQVLGIKFKYGSDKGAIKRGDVLTGYNQMSPLGYGATNYSSEDIDMEDLGTPASGTTYSGTLMWKPVHPGSINIDVDNSIEIVDDGKGNLTSSGLSANGKIDYNTGDYEFVLTAAATDNPIAAYSFNIENAPSQVPEITTSIEERMVKARARKLKSLTSFMASYDAQMQFGLNIDDATMEVAAAELKHEIDGEFLQYGYEQAGASSTWNMFYDSQGSRLTKREFYEDFISELVAASNTMFEKTRRYSPNTLTVGSLGATILETIGAPRFVGSGMVNPAGPHFAGILDNKYKVYKNPFFKPEQYFLGYKSESFLETGLVYLPYLPLFATQLLMLDDFVGRRGFATSYGKIMINRDMYIKGVITETKPTP